MSQSTPRRPDKSDDVLFWVVRVVSCEDDDEAFLAPAMGALVAS